MPEAAAPNPFSALTGAPPPPPAAPAAPPQAKPPLVVSNPMEGDAQARFRLQQEALTRSDPWRDPGVKITKAPDGTVTAQPRTGDPAAAPQPGDQLPPGPASVEGGRLKVGDLDLGPEDVKSLLERHALESSRRATMPASTDQYTLPTDMPMPPGMSWQWRTDDPVMAPLLGQVKEWAFAHGVDQPGFNKLLGTWVAHELAGQAQFERAQAAEREKLGPTSPVRISAVQTFLNAHLGTESAKALTQTLFTAAQVQAFEKLMHTFVSQGSGSFRGSNREPEVPGKISDEAYSKLSYGQRIEYASKFPQQPGGR
jgi:hypothetical protein